MMCPLCDAADEEDAELPGSAALAIGSLLPF